MSWKYEIWKLEREYEKKLEEECRIYWEEIKEITGKEKPDKCPICGSKLILTDMYPPCSVLFCLKCDSIIFPEDFLK